ncbi:MAG TPA: hypothetical protein VJO15_00525, partial [Dehalococcoidia bacterium]|nr:hypothetical protein [Dehalococcoidia bacterium]
EDSGPEPVASSIGTAGSGGSAAHTAAPTEATVTSARTIITKGNLLRHLPAGPGHKLLRLTF